MKWFKKKRNWLPLVSLVLASVLVALLVPFGVQVKSNGDWLAIGYARAAKQEEPVGEIVEKRTQSSKTTYLGSNRYSLDTKIGSVHYKDNPSDITEPWKEIDNQFNPAVAPWNWEMTQDGYKTYVLNDFTAGQVLKFESQGSTVTFQPMGLLWTNNLDQLQQISMPQNVLVSLTNTPVELLPSMSGAVGTIRWNNAYGVGRHFEWTNSPGRLNKLLQLDSILPAPPQYIIDGGTVVLKLDFIFDPSSDLEIYVDGALWDKSSKKQTVNNIEFYKAGERFWVFKPIRYWGSDPNLDSLTNEGIGTTVLSKSGKSLYVSSLVPYGWLQKAVYPVFIDPTTELFPSDYRYFHADAWDGDLKWLLDMPDGATSVSSSSKPAPVIEDWTANDSAGDAVTSITFTKPVGVAVDDLLLLIVGSDQDTVADWNSVTGWIQFININDGVGDSNLACYWRIADGTEGVTVDVTAPTVEERYGWYLRISGVDTTTPINVTGTAAYVASDSHSIPEVTTTVADCLAFYALVFDGGDGAPFSVAGTGWTEVDEQTSGTTGTDASGCWGTKSMPTAGATGAATVTSTVSDGSSSIQFAIAPRTTNDYLIQGFASEDIVADSLSAGHWGFYLWGKHDGTILVSTMFVEVRKNNSTGTLLATSTNTPILTTAEAEYYVSLDFPETAWTSGDKVWVGVYATVTTKESGKRVYFYYDHSSRLSRTVDPTLDVQVGASADDCVAVTSSGSGSWSLTQDRFNAGAYDAVNYGYFSGARFQGITLDNSQVISIAYLRIKCVTQFSGTDVRTKLSAEDIDDAPAFTSIGYDDYWARTKTTAQVDWDISTVWSVDTTYNSAEIKTVVQEVVDRGGWASGQDIVIFWEDDSSPTNAQNIRRGHSWDAPGNVEGPILHIEYEAGGGAADISNTPPNVEYGVVGYNKSYWSNTGTPTFPLDNTECYFNVTNSSGGAVTITINATAFTGGVGWTLGAPALDVARMTAWISGAGEEDGVVLNATQQSFIVALADTASKEWELRLESPTDYSDGVLKQSIINLVATLD